MLWVQSCDRDSFPLPLGSFPVAIFWDMGVRSIRDHVEKIERSSVHLAIGPTMSLSTENGKPPSSDTVPGVVLSAYSAARMAGFVRDSLQSAPIETGAKPALTPTAEPVDDPDGF